MTPLRIAVIGAGQIGRRHMDVLLPDSAYAVAGIADPMPASKEFADQHDIPYFSDTEEMLDKVQPDGAIVASPNQFHMSGGMACISREVPVLIEKPVADSLTDALTLVNKAKQSSVPVMVGHHRRHNPIIRKAWEVIQGGGIGKVTAVNCLWLTHKPDHYFDLAWRREAGGGTVLINGIHEIDYIRMLCGEIDSIQAVTANAVRGFPVEDTAAAVIHFENGALGTLLVSDAVTSPWTWECTSGENPDYPQNAQYSFLITGTKGSLAVPTLDHWWQDPEQHWFDPMTRQRIPITPADPYVEQMRNFSAVIRGEEEPVVSGEEGTRTLAATLAITESAAIGGPVRINDMLARASG
jgi:predicted dehydrogenase